ncbi:MAG: selenoneine biosynthesis selenosugar synthase SenB [Candidatus Krumholzibacteriia bacterium]
MITPSSPAQHTGNTVTAGRWAHRLRELGHRVRIAQEYDGAPCDLLVALHARRSAAAATRFRRLFPERPLVIALTGTDLYRDLERSAAARRSLDHATRIVLLQPLGVGELERRHRQKCVVILQSAVALRARPRRRSRTFDVAVLGHLRHVKDPMRAAYAARRLPPDSRIRILHAGRALTPSFARAARGEMRLNRRYVWRGDLSRGAARRLLVECRALVLSSRMEGGANVISEAVVAGLPVLASRIPGSVGLLGPDYAGYFEVGDTTGLAALLHRVETEGRFAARLRHHVRRLAPRFRPARERAAWKRLLRGVLPRASQRS